MTAITLNIDYKALALELAPVLVAEIGNAGNRKVEDLDLTGIRWNRKQVCEHLGIKESALWRREKLTSFPRRVNDGGQPRWLAKDIVDYALGNAKTSATSDAVR